MPIPITIGYNAEAVENTLGHAILALDNLKDAFKSLEININTKETK